MNKLPGIGRYKGMPVSLVRMRKAHTCKECRVALEKGDMAYRPLLFGNVGDVMRCDRICHHCMKAVGEFIPGS
jgi:hypothetical protein